MIVTPERLAAATGCRLEASRIFAGPLSDACTLWGMIANPARVAAFVAQVAYESAKFTTFVENLNYSTADQLCRMWPTRFRLPADEFERLLERFQDGKRNPYRYTYQSERLGEYVYGGRLGNGPEGTGDGYKHRGYGGIQLTGLDNHMEYGVLMGFDAARFPQIIAEPAHAMNSAGYFWQKHGLNELADIGDHLEITRKITGALTGWQVPDKYALSDRSELVASAGEVFA